MARLDPCDKWGICDFSLENFLRVLDSKRVREPGYLGPGTIAKVTAYGLQIAESTTETMQALTGLKTWTGMWFVNGRFCDGSFCCKIVLRLGG